MKTIGFLFIFGYAVLLENVSNAPAAPSNAPFNISRSTNASDIEPPIVSNSSEFLLIKNRNLKCGFPNNIFGAKPKRTALLGGKWSKSRISYIIFNYPSSSEMTPTEVKSEIQRAFDTWSEHTNLVFFRTPFFGDIRISFESDEHGDDYPFYLNSTEVAHATFQGYDEIIHFNDHKTWTINSPEGLNLFEIAVHEIGHNLGLDHSTYKSSVMYKWTTSYNPNFRLSQEDIDAIQALYGPKQVTTANPSDDVEGSGFDLDFEGSASYEGSGSGDSDLENSGSGDGGNEESDIERPKYGTFFVDHGAQSSTDRNDCDDCEASDKEDKAWYFEEESRQIPRLVSLSGSNKFLLYNWRFAVLMWLGTILY